MARISSGRSPTFGLFVILIAIGALAWNFQYYQRQTAHLAPSETPPQAQQQQAPDVAPRVATAGSFHFRPTSTTLHLQTIEYAHYAVGYDNSRKCPAWVVYELDGPVTFQGAVPDRPTFATEFKTSAHVSNSDYTNSGFDRGHLYPAYAAFSRYGPEGFRETFIMSNVIPQPHAVNAGIWEDLETDIAGRSHQGGGWAESLRNVTVINGPIYSDQPDHFRSGVTIPSECFSVVLDYQEDDGGYKALAFKMPNKGKPTGPLSRWLVTIRSIETNTGLDILSGMGVGIRGNIADVKADAVWPGIHP